VAPTKAAKRCLAPVGPTRDDALLDLWRERPGPVGTHVLQASYVNLRMAGYPLSATEAPEVVSDCLAWEVVVTGGSSVIKATLFEERFSLPFWDAMIVVAANPAGADVLLSEDLSHGQRYGEVVARNPSAGL
jgi:predicted nucleic acid-binding protein